MKTKIREYLDEHDVKKALKIDSFRNLSKSKIMEFASMIPYMDKEIAKTIINQFPKFTEFGSVILEKYKNILEKIIEKNNESNMATIESYQKILNSLELQLKNDEITSDERERITEKMISVADKISELDQENKKFLEMISNKFLLCMVAVIGTAAAVLGVNSSVGSNNGLPEIEE